MRVASRGATLIFFVNPLRRSSHAYALGPCGYQESVVSATRGLPEAYISSGE